MVDELKHVGILGMRWGRRKSRASSPGSDDHQKVSVLKKKKLKDLSNDELKAYNTRKLLEKQFKDLNPSVVKQGNMTVENTFKEIGKYTMYAATAMAAIKMGLDIYTKVSKISSAIKK